MHLAHTLTYVLALAYFTAQFGVCQVEVLNETKMGTQQCPRAQWSEDWLYRSCLCFSLLCPLQTAHTGMGVPHPIALLGVQGVVGVYRCGSWCRWVSWCVQAGCPPCLTPGKKWHWAVPQPLAVLNEPLCREKGASLGGGGGECQPSAEAGMVLWPSPCF